MTGDDLTRLARAAIARGFGADPTLPVLDDERPRGLFVTLRGRADGKLRGCIGRIQPQGPRLTDDLASCAWLAATEDPRFAPLRRPELDQVTIEVTLLDEPEAIASLASLDPARYGVVVRQGPRTGVLLPDIEGVDSAAQQVDIARQKAGIAKGSPMSLFRFTVQKFEEV